MDRVRGAIRGPTERTVAEDAMAIHRIRLAQGEINEQEIERARALALSDHRGVTTMTSRQPTPTTRSERRAATLEEHRAERRRAGSADYHAQQRRRARIRTAGFGLIAVAVLGAGVFLAAGDLLGQRGSASAADAIPVRLSMAGFTPGEVRVPAGETVALELWTTDAAPHLANGVHTMISDELGIYEELAAAGPMGESRRVVEITAPTRPGTYDIYCDTCCGGKASPTMHGKLIVEA
jgi:plastocyanin